MISNIIDKTEHAKGKTILTPKKRRISTVKYVMIHHTGTLNLTVDNLINSHLKIDRNWPRVGYHYYITKKGNIYKLSNIDTVVNGCKNHNTNTLHICYEGNYENENFEMDFENTFKSVLIDLPRSTCNLELIHHGEKRNTLCPGINLINRIEDYRRKKLVRENLIWPEIEL